MKGIGREEGSLYILRDDPDIQNTCGTQSNQKIVAGVSLQDCDLWHRRLGHPSSHVLKCLDLLHNNKDVELLNSCSVCPLAKQPRLSFPISNSKTSMSFELVHMDLWGPYKIPTFDKK